MRVVLALALSLALVPAAFAADPPAGAAQPPAPAAQPAGPSGTPPTRFDWQGQHKKGQAALAQRDFKGAVQIFTDILNSGRLPKNWVAPTYYMRGKAHRSAKQYNEAVADYQKAVETDPTMDIAFYEMGAAYQELNQHAKAIDSFSKAISLKQNNAGYYYARCVSESSAAGAPPAFGESFMGTSWPARVHPPLRPATPPSPPRGAYGVLVAGKTPRTSPTIRG